MLQSYVALLAFQPLLQIYLFLAFSTLAFVSLWVGRKLLPSRPHLSPLVAFSERLELLPFMLLWTLVRCGWGSHLVTSCWGGWQNWKHNHLPFWFKWQKARTEVLNKHCKAWNKRGRVQVWGGTSTGRLLLEHTVELKTLRGHTAIKLLEFQRPHPGCDLPNILQYCILAA